MTSPAFDPANETRLVTCSCDKAIKIWDISTGKELSQLTETGHSDYMLSVAFNPSDPGQRASTCPIDESIKIWNFASGSFLSTLNECCNFIYGFLLTNASSSSKNSVYTMCPKLSLLG